MARVTACLPIACCCCLSVSAALTRQMETAVPLQSAIIICSISLCRPSTSAADQRRSHLVPQRDCCC